MKGPCGNFIIGDLNQSFPTHLLNSSPVESGWSADQVISHLKNHPSHFLTNSNELMAFILYLQAGEVLEICYLETLPKFQRQGLMSFLLLELIAKFPSKKIWLDVHGENQKALGLYRKLGFKNSGLRKGYYRDGGDCLLLERRSKA